MESWEKPFPRQQCPACGGGIDRGSDLTDEGQALEVGDAAICQHCGTILEVVPGLHLLALTNEEVRRRCSPGYFQQLMEVQRTVRAGGQLIVTKGDGEMMTVEGITPTDGRPNRDHQRN